MSTGVKMEAGWKEVLQDEFEKPYFLSLKQFLISEKQQGKKIFPPGSQIFSAFDHIPFDRIKVVILGQDPYHGDGQAHGLCFSVNTGIPLPPSLRNIFKELEQDVGCTPPASGNLTAWANQGVLLLNATLTVEAGKAGSHQNKGWEQFTDKVIQTVSERQSHLVFMLWGNYARSKAALISAHKHLILEAAHPSPLARGAFFGCRHFSKANSYLEEHGKKPVNWQL
jgi:uracil-DNA glycosylase